LKDWQIQNFISCVVRTGSPAYPRYNVELVYISPTWVENNKTILKEASPKGTGENDFAFLRITSKIDGTSVEPLPYTPVNIRDVIESGETVDLVSYPAGFLGGQSISQDLNLSSALTKVGEIFTFSADTIDLISVPGTVVSQKGASGGGVFDANGTLIGIITTSSDSKTTGERDLRAITLGYINRVLEKETGDSISKFLSKDVARYAADFQANTAPLLAKIIEDAISK
jgi:S1-C subfamily serine protease